MKLSQLIHQANTVYDLRLRGGEKQELQRRLISAGFDSEINKPATSAVLDAILQTTDSLRSRRLATATTSLYSDMKTVTAAAANQDGCPRCGGRMKMVALVNDREAHYCGGCAITLPSRA
jgi:formamidopyrimidine-DNA glycosylase